MSKYSYDQSRMDMLQIVPVRSLPHEPKNASLFIDGQTFKARVHETLCSIACIAVCVQIGQNFDQFLTIVDEFQLAS